MYCNFVYSGNQETACLLESGYQMPTEPEPEPEPEPSDDASTVWGA
jgi:hypothetical protein